MGLEVKNDEITEATANSFEWSTSIVIFNDFSGSLFEALRRRYPSQRPRIFGPAAILATAQSKDKKLYTDKKSAINGGVICTAFFRYLPV